MLTSSQHQSELDVLSTITLKIREGKEESWREGGNGERGGGREGEGREKGAGNLTGGGNNTERERRGRREKVL